MKRPVEKIKRVGLVGNSEKPGFRRVLQTAARLVARSGRQVFSDAPTARLAGLKCAVCADVAELTRRVEVLLVFGGDGTMLRVAREIAGSRTPILGINLGGMGFLTAVPCSELARALALVWGGKFTYETRALIDVSGRADGRVVRQSALNDCVISRGSVPRLIELEVSVDGRALTRYRCDGLIISTPTGSTAYALASGGAIVAPDTEVLELTPICPHTLSNRSIIVGLHAVIQVRVISPKPATILSTDGQAVRELAAGDVVMVRRSPHVVRLIRLAGSSFFETLQKKLNWRGAYV